MAAMESSPSCDLSPSDSPSSSADHLRPRQYQAVGAEDGEGEGRPAIHRDIRRYYCDYCGICRSKKSLIRSHMLTHHKNEMPNVQDSASHSGEEANKHVSHTCQECGANFKKPAYLKQHMQSHSLED